MIKIGITGQRGFIGSHMFNFLGLQNNVERVIFKDEFFNDMVMLRTFVSNCDVIVHLAAINRHSDPAVIYKTNVDLVQQLIEAMEVEKVTPFVIFSSSTQEESDNMYGSSKKEGRERFNKWAIRNNAAFAGLVIPNVFGPFGLPFYNSVIATFCYQLTHNESPEIKIDKTLNLIYVSELVSEFWSIIKEKTNNSDLVVKPSANVGVSEILAKLKYFRTTYLDNNTIPEFSSTFETNLYNTFRSYIDISIRYPVLLKKNTDERGSFIETLKTMTSGQFSYSSTCPGITRGNHFHTRKIERFIVIKGNAVIKMRRIGTSEVLNFMFDGKNPAFIDIPIWYTHCITNTGSDELLTLFWINEFYDPADPDTFFEDVSL